MSDDDLMELYLCFKTIDQEYESICIHWFVLYCIYNFYQILCVLILLCFSGSGEIDPEEFYAFLEETTSPFVENLGALISLEEGAAYSYFDFVRITATFCCFDEQELLKCMHVLAKQWTE